MTANEELPVPLTERTVTSLLRHIAPAWLATSFTVTQNKTRVCNAMVCSLPGRSARLLRTMIKHITDDVKNYYILD